MSPEQPSAYVAPELLDAAAVVVVISFDTHVVISTQIDGAHAARLLRHVADELDRPDQG